jgi:hypothetical protein
LPSLDQRNAHDLALGTLYDFNARWQIVNDLVNELIGYFLALATLKLDYFHEWISLNCQWVAD